MNNKLVSLKFIALLMISVGIIFNINSCKESNNEFLIISDINCEPPCWENIIPGETTKSEVVQLLMENTNVDPNSIAIKGEQWNGFSDVVFFKLLPNQIKGEIEFINDKVALINLSGNLDINFSEAIEKFGEPDYILNIPLFSGTPGFPQPSYEIQALIPNKGVNYAYNTNDSSRNNNSIIAPENKITRIDYYNISAYDQILDAGMFSEGHLNKEESIKNMIPWSGYGEIDQKYPPANIP